MAPRVLVLAAAIALAAPVQAAAVGQPDMPTNVRAWLGAWVPQDTGRVYIYQAHWDPSTSGAEDCPCSWHLYGEWQWDGLPGRDKDVPLRGVLSNGYQDYNAGWPNEEGGARNGVIFMRRSRNTFHGYWSRCSICGIRDGAKWNGKRSSEQIWRVGFRMTQSGRPNENAALRTRTGIAGGVFFVGDDRENGETSATAGGAHIELIPQAEDLRLELGKGDLSGDAAYSEGARGARSLSLALAITATNDPNCQEGDPVRFVLADRPGRPAAASLHSACGYDETFTSTDKQRLNVTVDEPQAIGTAAPTDRAAPLESRACPRAACSSLL